MTITEKNYSSNIFIKSEIGLLRMKLFCFAFLVAKILEEDPNLLYKIDL